MDLLEDWTCVSHASTRTDPKTGSRLTLEDVGGVGLLSGLGALLLVSRGGRGSLLAGLLLLSGRLASRGLAGGGGLLLSSFWCHCDVEGW